MNDTYVSDSLKCCSQVNNNLFCICRGVDNSCKTMLSDHMGHTHTSVYGSIPYTLSAYNNYKVGDVVSIFNERCQ